MIGRHASGSQPGTIQSRHAAETLQLYASDWARFARFYAAHGASALPTTPARIVRFLQQESVGLAALRSRVAAIDQHHRARGLTQLDSARAVCRALRQARAAPLPRHPKSGATL